jgi:glycosyltransferase involved in cell wall biosynthesis
MEVPMKEWKDNKVDDCELLLSILTISFNQYAYLKDNLNTMSKYMASNNVEHIIIDPGSTDGSRELIAEYESSHENVTVVFEEDFGPADGLNKGLSLAKGKYIGVINSDDFYLPDSLDYVLKVSTKKNSEDILLGNGYVLENGVLSWVEVRKLRLRNFSLGNPVIFQPSMFFRRDFLNKNLIAFNSNNKTCWDAELILDMLICGASQFMINTGIGVFRIHLESLSGSNHNKAQYAIDFDRLRTTAGIKRVNLIDRIMDRLNP